MRTHRLRDAAVGLGYLALVAALIALSIAFYNHAFDRTVDVTLNADKVGSQLREGSDVKVRGVLVGEVSAVRTTGTGATLELALQPDKTRQIPANVSAQLLPKTLFGERYVALVVPRDAATTTLSSGDTVQQDRSKKAVELQNVFDNLLPLLKSIEPQKLAATLGEVAQALRNRGGQLGDTIVTVNHYLRELSPQIPTLTKDLDMVGDVSDAYNAAAPDFLTAVTDLAVTSKTLAEQQKQLKSLFTSVTATATTAKGFLDANAGSIIGLSKDSLPTLRIAAERSKDFPCIADMLTKLKPKADKAFGKDTNEPGLHGTLVIRPTLQPYTDAGPSFPTDAGPACAARATGPTELLADKGIGDANSPSESTFLNEMIATRTGQSPQELPGWSSLLLGPLARGSEVGLR